jgi:hypothetical protein
MILPMNRLMKVATDIGLCPGFPPIQLIILESSCNSIAIGIDLSDNGLLQLRNR